MSGTILAFLLVLFIGAVGGAAHGYLTAAQREETKPAVTARPPASIPVPASILIEDLPVIVTNLGEPNESWIRVEAAVLYDPKVAAGIKVLAREIANDILAYLRSTRMEALEGAEGLRFLKEDITERARLRSKGQIKDVFIHSLVVQ